MVGYPSDSLASCCFWLRVLHKLTTLNFQSTLNSFTVKYRMVCGTTHKSCVIAACMQQNTITCTDSADFPLDFENLWNNKLHIHQQLLSINSDSVIVNMQHDKTQQNQLTHYSISRAQLQLALPRPGVRYIPSTLEIVQILDNCDLLLYVSLWSRNKISK